MADSHFRHVSSTAPLSHYSLEFFLPDRFPAADQSYVRQRFGVLPFEQAEETVLTQVNHLARQQMNPTALFRAAPDFIRSQRVGVPTFATLAALVTRAFRTIEQQLLAALAQHLAPTVRQQLDAFFTPKQEGPELH